MKVCVFQLHPQDLVKLALKIQTVVVVMTVKLFYAVLQSILNVMYQVGVQKIHPKMRVMNAVVFQIVGVMVHLPQITVKYLNNLIVQQKKMDFVNFLLVKKHATSVQVKKIAGEITIQHCVCQKEILSVSLVSAKKNPL